MRKLKYIKSYSKLIYEEYDDTIRTIYKETNIEFMGGSAIWKPIVAGIYRS